MVFVFIPLNAFGFLGFFYEGGIANGCCQCFESDGSQLGD